MSSRRCWCSGCSISIMPFVFALAVVLVFERSIAGGPSSRSERSAPMPSTITIDDQPTSFWPSTCSPTSCRAARSRSRTATRSCRSSTRSCGRFALRRRHPGLAPGRTTPRSPLLMTARRRSSPSASLRRPDALAGPLRPGNTGSGAPSRRSRPIAAFLILRKGMHPGVDSYSAFVEADGETTTGLAALLQRPRGEARFRLRARDRLSA